MVESKKNKFYISCALVQNAGYKFMVQCAYLLRSVLME